MNVTAETFSNTNPDIVLNCAAYNFVDKAEEDFDTAYKVNASGVRNLAFACKKNNALLVHYSTDYIFDGKRKIFIQRKMNRIRLTITVKANYWVKSF